MLKLSSVRVDRKTLRKSKNKARKIISILFPLTLACAIVSGVFIYLIIATLQKPAYVSPLSTLGIQAVRSEDDAAKEEIEKLLKEQKISFVKVTKGTDSSYIIHLAEDKAAIVSSDKDMKSQISSLQFILSRLTMEGKLFSRLDLRFKKPIVVFK